MSDKHRRRAALTGSRARRKDAPTRARFKVARTDSLAPGESMKFMLPIRGADEECFLINFSGEFHAYVNRCRHVPMAMDWVDNQFFAEDGRYLMCQTHNAYYEPASGECYRGAADRMRQISLPGADRNRGRSHLREASAGRVRRLRKRLRFIRTRRRSERARCAP